MVIFAEQSSPRLQHMANWLGQYLFGKSILLITDISLANEAAVVLNYSTQTLAIPCLQLAPHGLLFQQHIQPQVIEMRYQDNLPYFFATRGDIPFDFLAASFYLLQRYEEFFSHETDVHGRYAHTNSLAFQHRFLHLPLIDLWMLQVKKSFQKSFPKIQFLQRRFQFQPTYDVDIAYSFRGKGWLRNTGAFFRSLLHRDKQAFQKQIQFFLNVKKDPFDVFGELDHLHEQYQLEPIYFFLLAQRQKGIDKNIAPSKTVYQQLIQRIAAQYKTGIHLSGAASVSKAIMQQEVNILNRITGRQATANRMHYLLFHLPETYQQLQYFPLSIQQEFSMGYGTINGFRASTCTPYYWYDLSTETSTGLQVFPFCYMEANSIFEQKDSPEKALAEMQQFLQIIRQVQGDYITIFHNHLIGHNKTGRQWMKMYQQFLASL